jgi:3-oxoadipate enol-lactonase
MPKTRSNEFNIYYEVNGQGEPIVFVHGLGSSTRDWEFQVSAFSKSYQVITFDLRGHGQSDKPKGPYAISMFAADLVALLQAVGIEPIHLVGLSLGGCIAFQFAIDYPAMVKTLTIVNSAPTVGETPKQAQQDFEQRIGIVQQLGMRAIGEALSVYLFPMPEHASLRQTLVERWAENDPRAYIEATRSMLNWNVTDQLGSIHCPTLIIAAEKDYSPVALKEAYVKLMPNAQLVVISDAHHFTPVERPQEFNTALAQFLAQHS